MTYKAKTSLEGEDDYGNQFGWLGSEFLKNDTWQLRNNEAWYNDRHPPAIKNIRDTIQPESRYTDRSPPAIKISVRLSFCPSDRLSQVVVRRSSSYRNEKN